MGRAGGVPIHPQTDELDRSLDEKGVRDAALIQIDFVGGSIQLPVGVET